MNYTATLTPAYGRDYHSARTAKADFLAGKDFIYNLWSSRYDGKPCSIRDFEPGTQFKLRYARLTKVVIVRVPARREV